MDRLKFTPAFQAVLRSTDADQLAALGETIRERGGHDEFTMRTTELIRKHPLTFFRLLRSFSTLRMRRIAHEYHFRHRTEP